MHSVLHDVHRDSICDQQSTCMNEGKVVSVMGNLLIVTMGAVFVCPNEE